MLLKLASMFLANIFYYPKIIFLVKERDTRLSHFWVLINEIYYIYLEINSTLALFKFCDSAKNYVVFFKFLKLSFLAGMQASKCCSCCT